MSTPQKETNFPNELSKFVAHFNNLNLWKPTLDATVLQTMQLFNYNPARKSRSRSLSSVSSHHSDKKISACIKVSKSAYFIKDCLGPTVDASIIETFKLLSEKSSWKNLKQLGSWDKRTNLYCKGLSEHREKLLPSLSPINSQNKIFSEENLYPLEQEHILNTRRKLSSESQDNEHIQKKVQKREINMYEQDRVQEKIRFSENNPPNAGRELLLNGREKLPDHLELRGSLEEKGQTFVRPFNQLDECAPWKQKVWKAWDIFVSKRCHTKLPPIATLAQLTFNPTNTYDNAELQTNFNQQHCCCLHFSEEQMDNGIPHIKSVLSCNSKQPPQRVKTLWAITRVNVFDDCSKTYEIMPATSKKPEDVPDEPEGVFAVKAPENKHY